MTTRSPTLAAAGPNPIDLHVGAMIRARRKILGVSQEVLADHLGLTFQQIQKYERGANRVSASMLFKIAEKLDQPVAAFFNGLEGQSNAEAGRNPALDLSIAPGGLEIARSYLDASQSARVAMIAVARALAPVGAVA